MNLDPPPHDRQYFEDHLLAAHNYWNRVSNGHVQIDLDASQVFPVGDRESYVLDEEMLFYHPYTESFDETEKLMAFARDAITEADGDVDFAQFTTIVLVHAGMGGDFAFALEPTPGNIPSAYLSATDFDEWGSISTDEGVIQDVIILPESQNFLQYTETRSIFEDSETPCFYQVALNGTFALLMGFHLGLPPMYDTESGQSLLGGFALMDQGSNNFHGIVPAYPNPYTRISEGWVDPDMGHIGDDITVSASGDPVKVAISDTEYYLIENRQRNLLQPADMTEWRDTLITGPVRVSVELGSSGVVTNVDEQDAGLPGSGLQFWHVDENARYTDENPNGGSTQFIDFEEADGAQDMGHFTQILFAEFLETGWKYDTWWAGNEGWFDLNRRIDLVGDSLLTFSSRTHPSTHSNSGYPSHLRFDEISRNDSVMTFKIRSDRAVSMGELNGILGFKSDQAEVWGFNMDSTTVLEAEIINGELVAQESQVLLVDDLFQSNPQKKFKYRYPWIIPETENVYRFHNAFTGDIHNNTLMNDIYEISTNSHGNTIKYFDYDAENEEYHLWTWQILSNGTYHLFSSDALFSPPLAYFTRSAGDTIIYGDKASQPMPAAAKYFENDTQTMDILTWADQESVLKIFMENDSQIHELQIDKPMHIIPMDTQHDGIYEIALIYVDYFNIINQQGTPWDGSPVEIEPFYGTPLIGSMMGEGPSIFFRHSDHYSIYAVDGKLLETGTLPLIHADVLNTLHHYRDQSILQTGETLLHFQREEGESIFSYWSDPQGNAIGNRTVIISNDGPKEYPHLKPGSAYNYPNPVKGNSTKLRAWIGEVDSWSIEIFSLNGNQILREELPVDQPLAYNEWVWDTRDISNGVFIANITAGSSSEVVKIAIIR